MSQTLMVPSQAFHNVNMPRLRIAILRGDADVHIAEAMTNMFQRSGIEVWTPNNIEVLPGQQRKKVVEQQVEEALEQAHFIIVLLSSASVEQRGEFPRWIRMAAEEQKTMPDGGILVIPIRLDQCRVPTSLSTLWKLDLWDQDAWQELVRAWKMEWDRRDEANDWW